MSRKNPNTPEGSSKRIRAIRKDEEKYRIIAENSYDWVFWIDPDGSFIYTSPSCERLTGYTREEFTNDPGLLTDIIHPEDGYAKDHLFRYNAPEKELGDIEFRIITKDGDLQWIRHSCTSVFDKNGKYAGRTGTNRNITDRKNAENALNYSHKLMSYIVEHDPSAIAIHDKDLNYIFVSKRYLHDYKVTEKDIIGKHHYDVFPDIPGRWKEVHKRVLAGEVLRSDEDLFEREDGSVDWTRWECRPWYEADGSVGGIILYTEVINDQKQKENKISELNRRLEILIESVKELASAQSIETIQQVVTSSARKLTGADGATIIFREDDYCYYAGENAISPLWKGRRFPLSECISGWVILKRKPVIIQDIAKDNRIPADIYNPTFVKSLAMVPVNTVEPFGAIGNYWKEKYKPTAIEVRLLQTLADSAARAIENVNLYSELEQRVSLRTAQLEALNKELETFTYSVSHDLKAPLRGIDGYSKLLLDQYGNKLDDEANFFISTIRSSTLQMNQLIDDLLEYSRLERTHISNEKIRIKPLLDNLISSYKEKYDSPDSTINLAVPDIEIQADPKGLSLVLRNIIENALKFSTISPAPVIDINLIEQTGSWIISVKDNGIGFDMKFHDRIFEIFQRLHRAEDFPGTGIGLAMVRKATERMNGRVWAESKMGNGSTFFIELFKQT
ncbi:MAG: PAS domain S-box protein [Bacteroidales bacterium]